MIIVHDIFICKPGNASKLKARSRFGKGRLAKKFKDAMSGLPEFVNIMTDLSGPYNKVVAVTRFESLTAYDQNWEKMKKNTAEMKRMEAAMAGYQDMYLTGSREIYQVW